eukprot:TRINITY_DN3906_c0_g2_i1.p1 TRINITY_DN3906_c0_g2~~TRINITY_DN3906_c0_g2_i1.p1  ORF type:complete len:120 (+),score=24.46 TRINITY_DN3906_c0_g2_i1:81-440(+)
MSQFTRSRALSLYRTILKLHKEKLPAIYRSLGDSYVRDEFKRHKTAKPNFLGQFYNEWEFYVENLRQQADINETIGRDMSSDQLKVLNDDQKQQLSKLKQEAEKVKLDLLEQELKGSPQ